MKAAAKQLASTDIDLSMLPESARELCDCIGIQSALRLCDALGGIRITSADPRIPQVIGEASHQKLVDHYADERFDLPRCVAVLRAAEAAEIVARLNSGEHARNLALEYRYTERWIWQIKRRAQLSVDSGAQADLFDVDSGH